MGTARQPTPATWRAAVATAALGACAFAVLWLALTLTTTPPDLVNAIVKIVFTIVAVVTALLGIRWTTASGIALFLEALAGLLWVVLRAETYAPSGIARTVLLLILPLAAAGVTLVLAAGVRAGTWPPARFRSQPPCETDSAPRDAGAPAATDPSERPEPPLPPR